jgi:ribokinase
MVDVALFGDINADVLMSIPDFPTAGSDSMATQVSLGQGGSAANSAVVLAKLGLRTGMIGRTGDDHWAEVARASLGNFGVDLRSVSTDQEVSTGLIFIPITASGERTLFSYRGANTRIKPEDIDPNLISSAQVLHLSGYNFLFWPQKEASWWAVETARENNTSLSLDSGEAPAYQAKGELQRLLPMLDLLVLGEREALTLSGADTIEAALGTMLDQGVRVIGLKLGHAGCRMASHGQTITIPPFDVSSIDTTGAGDAFSAGLIYSYLNKFSLPAAGLFANALGGLATTVLGGGSAFPPHAHVIKFLEEQSASTPYPDSSAAFKEILAAL